MPDEAAPVGQPVEFKAPEGHRLVKETEWLELDNKARQYDDLNPKAERWRQQASGSQKLHDTIKSLGFDDFDSALPHLGVAAKLAKLGANPEHLTRAFTPQEPEGPKPLDEDAIKSAVRSVLSEVRQQETESARQKALNDDTSRMMKLVDELAGEKATEWDRISVQNVLEGFYVRALNEGATPGQALDAVVEKVKAIRTASATQERGQKLAAIAETGRQQPTVKTPTTGGMGTPKTESSAKRQMFSDEDADARAAELVKGLLGA